MRQEPPGRSGEGAEHAEPHQAEPSRGMGPGSLELVVEQCGRGHPEDGGVARGQDPQRREPERAHLVEDRGRSHEIGRGAEREQRGIAAGGGHSARAQQQHRQQKQEGDGAPAHPRLDDRHRRTPKAGLPPPASAVGRERMALGASIGEAAAGSSVVVTRPTPPRRLQARQPPSHGSEFRLMAGIGASLPASHLWPRLSRD
jgi:hypothetical protein